MSDHYEILEVSPQATPEEIMSQYHFLVQAWHPDKFASPENKEKAEEKLKRINEAKTILMDPVKRQDYDFQRLNSNKEDSQQSHPEGSREANFPAAVHTKEDRKTGERSNSKSSTDSQTGSKDALWNMLTLELAAGVVMEFLRIPAGKFLMGSDNNDLAYPDEQPQHEVFLQEYLISKYLVTNRQYQAFLYATGYSHWEHDTIPANKEKHPVVSVNWLDAVAFCEWICTLTRQIVRLPSEAEWEKAARGSDGRMYPWGNRAPDNSLSNYGRNVGDTTQVGAYPSGASPYGAMDMAGNAWEWVNDLYDQHYYNKSSLNNPSGPASGEYRILRGGSWSSAERSIRTTTRLSNLPGDAGYASGFRCARDVA